MGFFWKRLNLGFALVMDCPFEKYEKREEKTAFFDKICSMLHRRLGLYYLPSRTCPWETYSQRTTQKKRKTIPKLLPLIHFFLPKSQNRTILWPSPKALFTSGRILLKSPWHRRICSQKPSSSSLVKERLKKVQGKSYFHLNTRSRKRKKIKKAGAY